MLRSPLSFFKIVGGWRRGSNSQTFIQDRHLPPTKITLLGKMSSQTGNIFLNNPLFYYIARRYSIKFMSRWVWGVQVSLGKYHPPETPHGKVYPEGNWREFHDHGMFGVGRDLQDHPVPSPCHGKYLPLDQAAQSPKDVKKGSGGAHHLWLQIWAANPQLRQRGEWKKKNKTSWRAKA